MCGREEDCIGQQNKHGAVKNNTGQMTTSRVFRIKCNNCFEERVWDITVLRHTNAKQLIQNAGFTREVDSFQGKTEHFCPECNEREKDTFKILNAEADKKIGTVEAWGIEDARRKGYEEFGRAGVVQDVVVGEKTEEEE